MYSRLSIQQVFNILAVGVSIAIALYGASYAAQNQNSKKSTAKSNICTPNTQASQQDDVYYATCGGFF